MHNSRFSILFILSIAIGFCGYFTLQSLKEAMNGQMVENARVLLSGDLSISSHRFIPKQEWQKLKEAIGPIQDKSKVVEFPAMAATRGNSRLVQVKAVDSSFPLYGDVKLSQVASQEKASVEMLNKRMWAWVDPELLTQLSLKLGDTLRVGDYAFEIVGIVGDGKANGWRAYNFMPRVYLGRSQVDKLHMLPKRGSLAFYDTLFLLPEGSDVDKIAEAVRNVRTHPGIVVHTPASASTYSVSVLGYLTDYLGLASLVSLFLAGLGAVYLLRSFIQSRYVEIAVLMCLGLRPSKARFLYLLEAVLLGTISVIPSALLSMALLPIFSNAVETFTPFKLNLSIPLKTILEVLLLAAIGSFCIALPAVESIKRLKPMVLLHESIRKEIRPTWSIALTLIPFLLFMWGLAVLEAHSFYMGTLFVAGVFLSMVILALLGIAVLHLLSVISHYCSLVWRLAMRAMTCNRLSSLACFIGLSLACLLMNLITQTQQSLDSYISLEHNFKIPSLFLFDIEEESLPKLEKLASKLNVSLDNATPLVSAQLAKRNRQNFVFDKKFSAFQTREEEREAKIRNRSLNLTYREKLSNEEKIVRGRPYRSVPPGPGELAEISIEERFAERLGLELGDVLEFDVQGVPVLGKIVNFRSIQWSTFRPNFFIQFQPGVLESAPKTYLGTLTIPQGIDKSYVQNRIVDAFPEVGIVDVGQALQRIKDTVDRMIWAMRLMAWTALATGLFVIYAIAHYQSKSQMWDISLMKALGASWPTLLLSSAITYGLFALMAAVVGACASYSLGMTFAYFLFDSIWVFSFSAACAIAALVICLSILCGLLATYKVLRRPAVAILNA